MWNTCGPKHLGKGMLILCFSMVLHVNQSYSLKYQSIQSQAWKMPKQNKQTKKKTKNETKQKKKTRVDKRVEIT